jgi:hypothetical protein
MTQPLSNEGLSILFLASFPRDCSRQVYRSDWGHAKSDFVGLKILFVITKLAHHAFRLANVCVGLVVYSKHTQLGCDKYEMSSLLTLG